MQRRRRRRRLVPDEALIRAERPASLARARFRLHLLERSYELPTWAEEYMTAMETTLGEAYSEPAADVRNFIAYVKSQSG